MGAANSVRKLTIDSIALLEQLEPNAGEAQLKAALRRRVQKLLARRWPSCRVLPYGSSESGLGFGGCDLDLGIYFDGVDVEAQGHFSPDERIEFLTTACECLQPEFEVREFVRHARVPILKLWDPKRQIACDLCVGGVHALLNTALLKYYGQADPRVRPLAFAVKYWAKQRGINESSNGTLSSYGFLLLLIFYLQSQHQEIRLPRVDSLFQNIMAEPSISALVARLNALPFMETIPSTFGTSEVNSVGALLAGFFEFYSQRFNIEDEVVSVRTGVALSKTTKWSHPVSWRISIEDPFELAHDVGRVVFHKAGQDLLNREFSRAFEMINNGHRWEDICLRDETAWNVTATCYICLGGDHTTRNCCQLSRHRMSGSSALGAMSNVASVLSDCWYCGEHGHYKANCPMLFFRDIPLPGVIVGSPDDVSTFSAIPPQKQVQRQQSRDFLKAVVSDPIPIPKQVTRTGLAVWERGASPASSVSSFSRPTKRKKRSRHSPSGSASPPPASPSSISSSALASFSSEKRHNHNNQRLSNRHQLPSSRIRHAGLVPWTAPASRVGGKKCAAALESAAGARRRRGVVAKPPASAAVTAVVPC